jgi:hypothetical protein
MVLIAGCQGAAATASPFSSPFPCSGDRVCIPGAGISFILPAGWSVPPATEKGRDLYTARSGDETAAIIVVDGTTELASQPKDTSLEALEAVAIESRSGKEYNLLSGTSKAAAMRVGLPIGPAVRLRYVATTIPAQWLCIEHWFFVNGRPYSVLYAEASNFGKPAPSASPGTANPPALDALLQSIRLLTGTEVRSEPRYFAFGVPSGWVESSSADPNLTRFRGPEAAEIVANSVQSSLTLAQVSASIIEKIKGGTGADPERTEAITMDGVPGLMLTYHFPNKGVSVYQLDAHCVRNGRAYEIFFANAAGNESSDRALFLSVLVSFIFGPGF